MFTITVESYPKSKDKRQRISITNAEAEVLAEMLHSLLDNKKVSYATLKGGTCAGVKVKKTWQ